MSLQRQNEFDILGRKEEDEALFDVLLHGIVGVDYVLHLGETNAARESSTRFAIEREERTLGGLMGRVAQILQASQTRVVLLGNPLGDDSNGRLLARQNQNAPFLQNATSQNLTSLETPYRVILQARGEQPTFLTRYQAAQEHDSSNHKAPHETANYPRAQKICVSDELPLSALHLARWAQTQQIPIFLACTGLPPINNDARLAAKELRELATDILELEQNKQAYNESTQIWNDARAIRLSTQLISDKSQLL